jgi:hypothetical protein
LGEICSTNGEEKNRYRLLIRKPERNRPLGRQRHGCVDDVKMGVGEIAWGDLDWFGLPQDREKWRALVNAAMVLWVPQHSGKLSSGNTSGGNSMGSQLHRVSF